MIINADCRDAMRTMESGSIDSIVTDPPYGLSFMGKGWDHGVPGAEFWELALHVLKPGGHLLAFGGTRTHHRLACAIEDAGWEIRDCLMWLYGSGFPKSLDVSKAIDKATGIEREDKFEGSFERRAGPTGNKRCDVCGKWLVSSNPCQCPRPQDAPQSVLAQQWDGWGTALKPSWEIIIQAQKPHTEATEQGIITANLSRLEAQLWSLLPASIAAEHFTLSPAEYDAVCASAQWSAEARRSTLDGLLDPMDTSLFVSAMSTCLNTVRSWRLIWADLLNDGNTFTTATKSSPTIELKTLNSLLSLTTPRTIIEAWTQAGGELSNALPVGRYLLAALQSMNATRELSALEHAISRAPTSRLDGRVKAPNWEPIILARKPLIGSVAANVTAYGTGALNIDGTRITACENGHAPVSLQSVLDGVQRICAALRQDSNGDTYHAHDGVGRDGMSPSDARYVGIRSRLYPNGVWCDLSWSGVRDSLDGCPACLRFGDEQSRRIQEAAQAGAPSLADALAGVDRELSTLRRIPNCQCDGHPSISGAVLWLQSLANLLAPNYTAPNVERGHNGRLGEASADSRYAERGGTNFAPLPGPRGGSDRGRWPANVVLDEDAAALLDQMSGERSGRGGNTAGRKGTRDVAGGYGFDAQPLTRYGDTGGASRFFYCAKASRSERGEGNNHPTVKPIELMRWLVRLITPSSGVVLDPFCGSGSTGCASVLEGFEFIGIDLDRDYCDIARTRIAQWTPKQGRLL